MEEPQESAAIVRRRRRVKPSLAPPFGPLRVYQQALDAIVRRRRRRGEVRRSTDSSPSKFKESILEKLYRKLGEDVSHSIVTVKESSSGNYSVGFVAGHTPDHKATFIFTASTFPEHGSDILVQFKDGNEVQARVHVRGEQFSLLSVKYNAEFKAITFIAEDVTVQTEAVIFAPTTESSCSQIPSFITQPSNPTRDHLMRHVAGSENNMLVSCRYYGKMIDGNTNLASSPIFNLKGEVVGIVSCNMEEDSEPVIKCGIRASFVKRIYDDLLKMA